MPKKEYSNISIPKTLVTDIDDIVQNHKNGFTSRAEFVKQSIRDLLDKIHQ